MRGFITEFPITQQIIFILTVSLVGVHQWHKTSAGYPKTCQKRIFSKVNTPQTNTDVGWRQSTNTLSRFSHYTNIRHQSLRTARFNCGICTFFTMLNAANNRASITFKHAVEQNTVAACNGTKFLRRLRVGQPLPSCKLPV